MLPQEVLGWSFVGIGACLAGVSASIVGGHMVFGIVFAFNSSLRSFLSLAYADNLALVNPRR